MESTGTWAPWCFLGPFIAASFLMIWRLEAMTESGVEGTVLGTLVMPYCSGVGNLIFDFVLGAKGRRGAVGTPRPTMETGWTISPNVGGCVP
jgi:cation:H+ antiporter